METLPFPVPEEQVKQAIRRWIELLSQDKYAEAMEMLYQGDVNPYWNDKTRPDERWTPELFKTVIGNYGMFKPFREGVYVCKVIPVSEAMRPEFETHLTVQWIEVDKGRRWGLDPAFYAGIVHVAFGYPAVASVRTRSLWQWQSSSLVSLALAFGVPGFTDWTLAITAFHIGTR